MTPWLIGETPHVVGVAREYDDWPGLGQGDHSQQCVQSAPMSGQPGSSQQLARRAAFLWSDGDHRDVVQDAMHSRVPLPSS
jgi:hypothetical protein